MMDESLEEFEALENQLRLQEEREERELDSTSNLLDHNEVRTYVLVNRTVFLYCPCSDPLSTVIKRSM